MVHPAHIGITTKPIRYVTSFYFEKKQKINEEKRIAWGVEKKWEHEKIYTF